MVVEVKKQHSNNLSHILISLEAVNLQLGEQLRFVFSDFPWQAETFVIAGVGMYWLWWKTHRSNYDIEEGSPYVPSSESDIGSTRTQHTDTAAIPFILGTATSDNEISTLQRMTRQMVDDRKMGIKRWSIYRTPREDLEDHWRSLVRRHKSGHQGGSAVGAEDGEGTVGDDADGGGRIEDDPEAVEERNAK